MKISVAMCTYNGERFLPDQLASIVAQDRLPDELIICDDRSDDGTAEIVKRFAATAPFDLHYERNPENLGSTRNFERAIALCNGDMIALADQDDVWLPRKLAALERVFEMAPDAGFAFSDAELVDERLTPVGYTLWHALGLTIASQRRMVKGGGFAILLKQNVVTGATLAFRAKHRELILPIPPGWVHDGWIALCILAVAECRLVPTPLIQYRQHSLQQVGERKRNLYRQYAVARGMSHSYFESRAQNFSMAYQRLKGVNGISAQFLEALRNKVEHCEARVRLRNPNRVRWPLVLRELIRGRYGRYSLGWKSLAQDLFL